MPVFRAYIVIFDVKIDLIGHRRLSNLLVTFTGFLDPTETKGILLVG
jgi:hypothetical protein